MEKERGIELIDYIRIVWRWKWFIMGFTLCCAVFAGIISFSQSKIYQVSMIIEPGVIEIGREGRFIYLDSPSNIRSKIDSQAYNNRIIKRLNLDSEEIKLNFKTVSLKSSNTVKVYLELQDVNKGLQALAAVFDILVEEYRHYTNSRKLQFDEKINMFQRQLRINELEKSDLEKEIAVVQANTDTIVRERNILISGKGSNIDKLTLLIYSNIIQQNIAHNNNFRQQLADVMAESERMKSEFETLRIQKESIENIKLIQSAQASPYPIKPKEKLNIVLGFVIGLLFSIMAVFFLEYLQKMGVVLKKRPTEDR